MARTRTQRSNECVCPWLSTSGPAMQCSIIQDATELLWMKYCREFFFYQMNHHLNDLARIIPRINEDLCGSKCKRWDPVLAFSKPAGCRLNEPPPLEIWPSPFQAENILFLFCYQHGKEKLKKRPKSKSPTIILKLACLPYSLLSNF